MKKIVPLLLTSAALSFTLGCGSDTSLATNTNPPFTSAVSEPEELEAPEAATAVLADFAFQVGSKAPLAANQGGVCDVAGYTPSPSGPARFVASFSDRQAGLLDRRLTVELGRVGGPLLTQGVVAASGLFGENGANPSRDL